MKIPIFSVVFAAFLAASHSLAMASGEGLYLTHCASCHGPSGQGGSSVALNKEGLLRTIGAGYIEKTIMYGRSAGCPGHKDDLKPDEIISIASFVKSWQRGQTLPAPAHDVIPLATPRGTEIFALCGGCHGIEGEGAMGPRLLDKGLLLSISDTELRRTIMWGRPGTPMKGFRKGSGALAELSEEEIDEVISYIRHLEEGMRKAR